MKNLDCNKIKYILLDIEGTCSDINFVRYVLFPYSAKELRNFLSSNRHNPSVLKALSGLHTNDLEESIQVLQKMIQDDVKHPSLKTLQGMIWKKGFESGEFNSPLYPDVLPALNRWQDKNLLMGIYSSGSVGAQKLFWTHTESGDLTAYFRNYFDLDIGSKKSPESYQKISATIDLAPEAILFLSDSKDEVLAAQSAGLLALQILRPGTAPSELDSAPDFGQIC